MGDNEILTAVEVAHYLRLPKSTLYYLVQRGQLPAFKVGRHLRFKRSTLEAWLERQENGSSEGGTGSKQKVAEGQAV